MIGRDAFQETDVVGITLPITKHSVMVQDIDELADIVREAFHIAQEGRPGPVLVDIPKDVQTAKAEWHAGEAAADAAPGDGANGGRPGTAATEQALHAAAELLAHAERPLIMAGHGVILADACPELRALAERTGVPVITTLLGISTFPDGHALHLGMPGMHGEVHVNRAIQQADVILGVGLRFDDRVTGNVGGFARQARIIHIDVDRTEIGKNVPTEVGLVGDAKQLLCALLGRVPRRECRAWRDEIAGLRREREEHYRGDVAPDRILRAIREASGPEAAIVSDVGQHQMWVAKLYPYTHPNSHFSSGGLGTMGFAVPAAMGVHFARPGTPVWAISGDGGFQMNLQEIATMVQERIPIKLAVFNNGYLGMVRQWQQLFHGRRYSATPIWSPNFVRLAEAYGIAGWRVEHGEEIDGAVQAALAAPGPALIEFVIEQEANVYPIVPPGGSLSESIPDQRAALALA
jgi:acetolactate synthase-1/2/3 large subunit